MEPHGRKPTANGDEEENGEEARFNGLALEIEDEAESLIQETTTDLGLGRTSFLSTPVFRNAQKRRQTANGITEGRGTIARIRGLLREQVGHHASWRNFALLAALSISLFLTLEFLGYDLMHITPQDQVHKQPPHQTTFGQHHGDFVLPKSNVGSAVQSISQDNMHNRNGHYLHHPYKSPYASDVYAHADPVKEQENFDRTREKLIQEWGWWTKPPFNSLQHTRITNVEYGDVPSASISNKAWQSNQKYVQLFLEEARSLVKRVKLGIYKEYGYSNVTAGDDPEVFRVLLSDYTIRDGQARESSDGATPKKGIAYMNPAGWNALVRKLLHAMMTEDFFYVVGVGGPYVYGATNFVKTQVMVFNYIMEPVLDKLGVKLVTRNMAMDASTTVSALGGSDVYGESDIFWYVDDPYKLAYPVEAKEQLDLLFRQAVLSGERVPILLTANYAALDKDADVWVGNIQPGGGMCEVSRVENGVPIVPDLEVCKYAECHGSARREGLCADYKSVCWVDRKYYSPDTPQDETIGDVGTRSSGFPSYLENQLSGRKLTLLVLHALEEALEKWDEEAKKGNLPLKDDLWHVGDAYAKVRNSVRLAAKAEAKPCETLLAKLDPMICHMALHVFTEWTPRVNPYDNGITNIILSNYSDQNTDLIPLYTGVDLLPLEWKDLTFDIDVHMLAIATKDTLEKTMEEDWIYNGDDDLNTADDDFIRDLDEQDDLDGRPRKLLHNVAKDEWTVVGKPLGFCDGSAQSHCNRRRGNKCLLANHNHYKAGILGHGNSGWLYMMLPFVSEGLIMLRFDWTSNVDYNENVHIQFDRLEHLPTDFTFTYSIDGEETKLDKRDFLNLGVKILEDVTVFPIYLNTTMSTSDDRMDNVKVGIRVDTRSGFDFKVLLTHIYYA